MINHLIEGSINPNTFHQTMTQASPFLSAGNAMPEKENGPREGGHF
jgi:hypothetical protein